jgi:hypothetical protein
MLKRNQTISKYADIFTQYMCLMHIWLKDNFYVKNQQKTKENL